MKKSRIRRIYDSKAFWAIVSLLVSLAMWVYVTSVESDETSLTFRNVPVELVGEEALRSSKNMVVSDLETSSVTVELTGPRRLISSWSSLDLAACVDVSKLSRASYTSQQYYISYPDGADTSRVSVTRKTPDGVNFVVSHIVSKSVPVRGSFDGTLKAGFTAEAPVFEPSSITITGPEHYIKEVSYAWVSFGAEDVDSTLKMDSGFVLMDEEGEPCETTGFSYSDEIITATLPLLLVKEVPLAVDIIPGAGATTENTKVRIEPEKITLAGDSALLGGLNKIVLDTIDLTEFTSTFAQTYTIPLDNELKNLTGASEATVSVEIVGLETRTFKVKNFSCINVSDGFEAVIISESIDVVVRGVADHLNQLKGENIRAVADLADYDQSAGQFMPAVKIMVDGFTDVGALGTNTISIEIRKLDPNVQPTPVVTPEATPISVTTAESAAITEAVDAGTRETGADVEQEVQ